MFFWPSSLLRQAGFAGNIYSPARRLEFLAGELRQFAGAIRWIQVTIWEEEVLSVDC